MSNEPVDPRVYALARALYDELLPPAWRDNDKRWQEIVKLGYAQRYLDKARRYVGVIDDASRSS